MEMEKRMQKVNISKYEIPLLGLDVGGVTVKITYFDIKHNVSTNDDIDSLIENTVNVNFAKEKVENREKLKTMINDYLKKTSAYTVREFTIKDIEGYLHCYLFRREKFNEFLQKLNSIGLKRPYIVLTGAALVNYMTKLEEDFHARVIIIPSENESIVRGIDAFYNQNKIEMFYEIELRKTNGISDVLQTVKPIKNIQSDRFYPSLLVIIGTSTAYLLLNSPTQYTLLNTSAISGQTFLGVCNAACKLNQNDNLKNDGVKSFDQCVKMATEGRSEIYDITIKQMCGNNDHKVEQFLYLHNRQRKDEYIQDFSELPVSVFGEVCPSKDEKKEKLATILSSTKSNNNEMNDFSAATLNLICYQIAETMHIYSKLLKVNLVVCAGSFLTNNLTAKMLLTKYMDLLAHNRCVLESRKKKLYFVDNEAYLASIGCININIKTIESLTLE